MSRYRRVIGTLVFFCLLVCLPRQVAAAEETEIRDMAKQYAKAFATHDTDTVLSFWAPEAVFTNPLMGVTVEGHDELADEFDRWFEQAKADQLEITINKITFPQPGQAVEKGVARLTFQGDRPPIELAFLALLVSKDGRWLYQKVRQIHLEEVPSDYNRLKELEWLVGDWIDQDEDVTVKTHTEWAMNRNFLIQRFTMWFYDQEVLSGQQIIGWDPVKQKIRSWIFDSDAGIGEGVWYPKANRWFVKIAYTFQDGTRASAIHSYTKNSDHSYTWASEARDIGGALLPNIGPKKIVRIEVKQ